MGYNKIKFKISNEYNHFNLVEGDLVIISDCEAPAKNFTAEVIEKNRESIIVLIKDNKFSNKKFPKLCRIDLLLNGSEYNKMIDNLKIFNSNVDRAIHFLVSDFDIINNKKIIRLIIFLMKN